MIKLLYGETPSSTYSEAYKYFLEAEKIQPYKSILNIYMLGKVTYCMKQYYRARYYLKLASIMPTYWKEDNVIKILATNLANKLYKYDLTTYSTINLQK